MRASISILYAAAMLLSVAAGLSMASEPEMFLPGPGGDPTGFGCPLWVNWADFAASVASSERIGSCDLATEVGDDFIIEPANTVLAAAWWGQFWNGFDGTPACTGFVLRFYTDAGGVPEADPFAEYVLPGDLCGEELAPGGDLYSQFEYWFCVDLPLAEGHYWFSVQAADHTFPPQWGRLGGEMTQLHSSCIRSEYFGHGEWVPIADVVGRAYDASVMLEDDWYPCPVKDTSWGTVKGLYR